MSKELSIPLNNPNLLPSKQEREITQRSVSGFIPAIKLLQGTSREVADSAVGKPGDFFFQGTNLGNRVKIIVCDRRPHAILFENNQNTMESFDPGSELWETIATTPRNYPQRIEPVHGNEWLMYICSIGEFGAMICGKASSKPMSDEIIDHITPIKQRKVAARGLPQTNVFEMWSKFEDKLWGANNRSYACHVTALKGDEVGDITSPSENQIKTAVTIFRAPLNIPEPIAADEPSR